MSTTAIAHEPRLSRRVRGLEMEGAFEVSRRVRQLTLESRRPIDLSIGEPDFPAPDHIRDAAVRALQAGDSRYGEPAGLTELREAITRSLQARGIRSDPGRIVVTPGAKPALLYTVLALVEPGDEVLVPDPGFPVYRSIVHFAGGRPIGYGSGSGGQDELDLNELAGRITRRTRHLILNSPHNPTGLGLTLPALLGLADLVERHDLTVISDEIYSRLWYRRDESSAPSIASLPGMDHRTIVVDGFSKTWCMTGWRLGYASVPPSLTSAMHRLVVNAHSCVPPFVQRAGLAALTGPDRSIRDMIVELRHRRDVFVSGLNRIGGVRCSNPDGAFYAFADFRPILEPSGLSDSEFASLLLDDFGLAAVPGSAFGPKGNGHLRFSFTVPATQLELGLERIHACINRVSCQETLSS